jgi:UDP-3-O-[3-hydroxymyristoyl] glucosamine N-acyltransferase
MYLSDLIAALGGEAIGEVPAPLTGVGTLERASGSEIAFLANPKYRRALDATGAGAVILSPKERDATPLPRIVTDNPYAYFARVAQQFSPRRMHPPGVSRLASVDASAEVHETASIAEFASIAKGARIGAHARIGPGCVVSEGACVGDASELVARVTVYADCVIGARCILHAGVVIGADGFGFAREGEKSGSKWVKIPQTGRVMIGDDCEIGANSTIDRGAIEDTVVGDGVKIDNQVQVGHNTVIGAHTIVSGCTGIAGSTTIGQRVMIGGAVSITGHLSICDDAVLSANAFVTGDITAPGMYSAGFPLMPHREWLRNAARLRSLDALADRVRALENSDDSEQNTSKDAP